MSKLEGLKILVVEDEAPIALLLEDILSDFGCEVTPVARIKHALKEIESGTFSAAILDVNVSGEQVYPVARALEAKGIPFVFSTGYGRAGVDPSFEKYGVLQKPFDPNQLERLLINAMSSAAI
jgi:CheY-like chemotaxis protein